MILKGQYKKVTLSKTVQNNFTNSSSKVLESDFLR